jgi:serine protease AprX
VAVLDTGISPVADVADRTVHGPDLSGEGSMIDTYGHGTVMGGIIAGSGQDSNGRTTGVAPEARLVAVKVAGRNGAVDVSTVLQGMAWISAYRQELGIRVLNLSYGTASTQDPAVDPLNFAVQRLWAQGIVVVVAAGNGGPGPRTITKPGDDPVVLTVGAYDDRGDREGDDDVVPAWSSQGPTAHGVAKPDLVAPGRTLVATRSFGSTVESENPGSLVAPSYVKGSGTSEATAVTSGLVALLLQAHPLWTPDQVKRALTSTAEPIRQTPPTAAGSGRVALSTALRADPGPALQQALSGTGLGSLEQSRGGAHVTSSCGVIQGEQDVRCQAWDAAAWAGNGWTGNGWTGNGWTGNGWTGNGWTGNGWTGNGWTGNGWTGNGWTGNGWTGNGWTSLSPEAGSSEKMLTAFWGDAPKASLRVPGERPAAEEPRGLQVRQTGGRR